MIDRTLLVPADLDAAVAALDGWSVSDGMLRRTITAPSFPTAIAFVGRIAEVAEELDHHPDIDIRWTAVHLAVVTHSANGITSLDVELARRVNVIVTNENWAERNYAGEN